MSYILDALRKADAERERDPARGIHAQPLAGLPAPERAPRSFAWVGGAAAGLAFAAAAVYLMRPAPPAPEPVGAAVSMPREVAVPAAVVPPAPAPVADAVVPAAPPAPPAPKPVPVAKVVPAAAPLRPTVVAPATQQVAAAPAAAVLKAPAAEVAPRVLAMKDLPPDVQRELPKLAITGGVHSDNAAQRMLIVGGQVFSEGATLAPGVVLEQISARAAVLQFRGHRFSVAY
ncbi:general secretion pathway protein GspB [Ramlibacter terrae]|uniref:General secretion pathway protein GspB n=1 Tax=Ramlibacter terrae TaxID=2732511 RepID=A0ABX6P5V0_9BURK|nr:general secretion pathway protein GspB [Ramlibacter terrae]